MNIDLDTLDLAELRSLRAKLVRAIEGYEARQRQRALEAVKAAAQEHGFSLKELVSDEPKKVSQPVVKYAHPENSELTWSGRGRRPRWVVDALDAGMDLGDLAV